MSDILVVEDSRTQAEQLVLLLRDAGHDVRVARDGVEALELARDWPPGLVLTDVVMPRMDGYELCRLLKADPELARTPVILLTSLSSPQDVTEGLACGADNFVRKPYEPASLLARVSRALAVREPAPVGAAPERVLDFLFSTFEETVHLDGELARSYQSLDLLYRLAEGLNRCATEREVVIEMLARSQELAGVHGAWVEMAGERLAGAVGSSASITDLADAPRADFGIALQSGHHVLGVLQLLGPDERLLDDDQLRTFETFGTQVGTALERVILQQHLEQRVRERTAALSAEVAARLRAEEALRAMAAIVESADDAMVRLGPDGRIETWNRGAARLYGYVADEAVGRSIELVVAPERVGEVREIVGRVAWGASIQGHETVRLRRDGTEVEVSLTLSPVRDADGAVVAVAEIARDITARKQLERALLQAQKLESVGRLAGGIAHDFNNLLTGVIGFSELALARMAADDPLRTFVEEARRAGERATELTQRLLAFGRRQTLRPRPLDLNAVVGELEPLLARLIGDQVELVVELADEPCPLVADGAQLEQVVMNLALNARDAMDGRGRLAIAVAAEADSVRLSVTDTGAGMDAETLARIFEPFFTTKPEGKGTGLGLSTVFGIVQQSGGTIAVESDVGRGTTFAIRLPRGGEVAAASAEPAADAVPRSGSGRVLVVEDDDSVRALLRGVLESAGYDVRLAAEPAEALGDAWAPDLLITDMLMPGMNGRELAARLVERAPGMRVLFISGYTGQDLPLDAGMRFLPKPFTPAELLEHVRAVLDDA